MPAPAGRRHDAVPALRGLTLKQAAITLFIMLTLGLIIGALELVLDWRRMREDVNQGIERTLALVEGSASEALYQLHPDLGRQLVDGLFVFDRVRRVELRDDFGQVLAEEERERPTSGDMHAWRWLFADVTHFERPLRYAVPGGALTEVGVLTLDLSPDVLAQRFLKQAMRDAMLGIARALFISGLVVIIFYFMITRPLLRLSDAIAEVDPARPGGWAPPPLLGHSRDELGLLLGNLTTLLQASQDGLDARDRAERQLTALTQDLDARVQARTRDLELQKLEVERALGQLDRAHSHLSEANGRLLESHRYARRIQTAMLPHPNALDDAVPEIEILWEPLHLVGGDWYWLERRGDVNLILLGDCTGHGVPGAFITLVVASATQQLLRQPAAWDAAEILAALDREVRGRLRQDRTGKAGAESESDDGLDAAVLIWNSRDQRMQFASVGGIPLIKIDANGEVTTIRGSRGHLGYQSLPPPRQILNQTIGAEVGSTFYLMTDGITDQMGGAPRRLLGRRRVLEWLQGRAELSLSDQLCGLLGMLERYRGDEPRRDDMTLVALRPF
ncbi:SpoIIE family protein phosphatase [Thiorhodococcus mannitoliphagus]|uniref:SpoIIE family protein phosphatase n=1 Tax=Thiorhodococcus mannitoliphagus TaxID=329406 RepID=A0A6P1DSQ0_9GAMM|nr:SpoIIE family protein phosphatase [Thiorhodococcus mannitoliphagus]NEX20223.1 SpoIIE family protein phosphatase [Thiorhodococcus mannitoliphagus]